RWGSIRPGWCATGDPWSTGWTRRCSAVCSISANWPRPWERCLACRPFAGSPADLAGLLVGSVVELVAADRGAALVLEVRHRLGRAEEGSVAHGAADPRTGDGLHVGKVGESLIDLLDDAAEAGALVVLVPRLDDPHHFVPGRGRPHPLPALAEVVFDLVERPVAEPAAGVEAVAERRLALDAGEPARLQPFLLEAGIFDLLVAEPAFAPLARVVARHRGFLLQAVVKPWRGSVDHTDPLMRAARGAPEPRPTAPPQGLGLRA